MLKLLQHAILPGGGATYFERSRVSRVRPSDSPPSILDNSKKRLCAKDRATLGPETDPNGAQ
jgi:hypothetical protein